MGRTTYKTAPKAGLYTRLSVDDGITDKESNSITSQKQMLMQYAQYHGIEFVETYVDDGWSGTNFERPDFKRMIGDIESGKINTVITKDLSRLGRDLKNRYPRMGVAAIFRQLKEDGSIKNGEVSESTVDRYVNLPALETGKAPVQDMRRYEHPHVNEVWCGDSSVGSYLTAVDGRKRWVYVIALIDDASRLATGARATMNELLGGEKLPKMEMLKKQRRELADKKKALYAEYRQAQQDMRQAVAVKANIDHLLGLTNGRDNKEQTR